MIRVGDTVITKDFWSGFEYHNLGGMIAKVKYITKERNALLQKENSMKCWGYYPIEHLEKVK